MRRSNRAEVNPAQIALGIQSLSSLFLRGWLILIPIAATCMIGCASNHDATGASQTPSSKVSMQFNVQMPSYANRKFSAYIFQGGVLKAAVLSNMQTNSGGSLLVDAYAVDANSCITANKFSGSAGTYNIHYRLDSAGTAGFVYPSICPSSAGFLADAGIGTEFSVNLSSATVVNVTSMTASSTVTFNFSGTGLNSVNRQVYCTFMDGAVASPSINTVPSMGVSQGAVGFTSGAGSATTTARVTFATGLLKYACWVDYDNSGTYNFGDLIQSGLISGSTVNITGWFGVP